MKQGSSIVSTLIAGLRTKNVLMHQLEIACSNHRETKVAWQNEASYSTFTNEHNESITTPNELRWINVVDEYNLKCFWFEPVSQKVDLLVHSIRMNKAWLSMGRVCGLRENCSTEKNRTGCLRPFFNTTLGSMKFCVEMIRTPCPQAKRRSLIIIFGSS